MDGVLEDRPAIEWTVASLQLFAGQTCYPSEHRQVALKKILRGGGILVGPPAENPEHMLATRGRARLFVEYSDLEKICQELSREDQENSSPRKRRRLAGGNDADYRNIARRTGSP